MESIEPKIVAAIGTAIHAYIEEARLAQAEAELAAQAPAVPLERINLWGIAGRRDLMMQRQLWQLRVY